VVRSASAAVNDHGYNVDVHATERIPPCLLADGVVEGVVIR
jgi:hypothetical protein